MRFNFDQCLRRLLAHEGGYSNHPSDPGGPTKFGITLADYRKYGKPDADAADVRAMRVEEAVAIYRERYWDALVCDELPAGLDYTVFDFGVNSGVARSGRLLRRLVGISGDDWRVTDDVFVALAARDPKTLVAAFNDERLAFLKRVSTWPVFGKGWARRVAEVRAVSLAMASAAGGSAKPAAPAEMPAHKPTGLKIRRALIGAVGAAIAIIAHRIVDGGAATVIAIALVTIACGAGWWLWRRRKAKFSEAP